MKAAKKPYQVGSILALLLIALQLTVQSLILYRLRNLENPHQVVFTIPQLNSSATEISCDR